LSHNKPDNLVYKNKEASMSLEKIADRVIETDVLVMGGGLAGCPAALKAKEHGLDVTLADKAAVVRSGSAGQGMDHYGSNFPRDGLSALDMAKIYDKWQRSINGSSVTNINLHYKIIKNAFWTFDELERYGCTMRWSDGEPYWQPWPRFYMPTTRIALRVHWQNIKPELARAVKKSGVRLLERTMVVDLLTNNGAVAGATLVNTRTGEFIVVKAKAVIVATGWVQRCFDPENPMSGKYKLRYHLSPNGGSGDGWGVVYRAGGELANLEINSWVFRMRDDLNCSFGNFRLNEGIPMKVFTWDGEEITVPSPISYYQLEMQGKTPIYYSLEHLNDDYQKRIETAFADERPMSFKIAEERGFNPRTHRYELNAKVNGFAWWNGVAVNDDFMTSVNGLFAAGDCVSGFQGCAHASTSGLLIGDNIKTFINKTPEPIINEDQVESQKKVALAPLYAKDGTEPLELESAIRYAMERYTSFFRSEGKLREGLKRLDSLRRVWIPKVMAEDPHQLMRYLECRNVLDVSELHMRACLERRETRGGFIRLDYPDKDPSWDEKVIVQRMENGKMVIERREMPKLKPEYEQEGK